MSGYNTVRCELDAVECLVKGIREPKANVTVGDIKEQLAGIVDHAGYALDILKREGYEDTMPLFAVPTVSHDTKIW